MDPINWYPGHMARSFRELKAALPLCDCVVEVTDSRLPYSGRNPELGKLIEEKRRLILLNKKDLADPVVTQRWISYYTEQGVKALACDARQAKEIKWVEEELTRLCQPIIDKARQRGRINRPLRVLIAGIPNSGKSTFMNSWAGKKVQKTANKPGVTRALQWSASGGSLQLLDSPGLLWPKLDTRHQQIVLGATSAIKDEIMPLLELAGELLVLLFQLYPDKLESILMVNRSILDDNKLLQAQAEELLRLWTAKQGFLLPGGEPDLKRGAVHCLKVFRDGRLGQFTLETPESLQLTHG